MSKTKILADTVSNGNILADGAISASEIGTGTLAVANGGTGATSLTVNNVLLGNGTSAVQFVAPGASGNVLTSNGTTWQSATPAPAAGSITAVASGSISNGAVVVVNSDGTVSAASSTNVSLSAGTPATVTTSTGYLDPQGTCAVLINPTTVVVFAQTSSAFTGWVGTISGSTITFGSAQQIWTSTAINYASCSYRASIDRIAVYGYDNSQPIVLLISISGNSLSLITFAQSMGSGYSASYQTGCCFNPVSGALFTLQNVVSGNVSYGLLMSRYTVTANSISLATYATTGNFVVSGEVSLFYDTNSGNMICSYIDWNGYATLRMIDSGGFNTAYVARSASCTYPTISYSPVAQKWLYVFRDGGYAGNSLGAIVATVSGTVISYGSAVQLATSVGSIYQINVAYDSVVDRFAIAYGNPSNTITFAQASVSGTVPTLTTSPTTLISTPTNIAPWSLNNTTFLYSSSAQKSVLLYGMSSSPYTLRGAMITSPGTVSTVTSSNVIGFSSASYTNGQTATVNTVGSSNNAQSGLTAGTKYYVQNDGTLSSSATTQPYVGVALSTTRILIKG